MLPTFATLVAVAIFVTAGNWQRARMEAKEALRVQLDAAASSAPAPLPKSVADWSVWRFRPITATGTFDADHQILIDNKVHGGNVGFDVMTPLRLDDGRVVLVDRGFIRAGQSRQMLPAAPPYPRPVWLISCSYSSWARVPIPKFAHTRGIFSCELRNQRDTSKFMMRVWFWI